MKELIPFLFLLLPLNHWSQTYHLLPDSCTFCMYLESWGGTSLFPDWYGVYPEVETTINGNDYILCNVNWGITAMRQSGNKLLGYHPDLDEDVLLMDFDAVPGDTIHGLYSNNFFYSARVEEIDSFQLNDGSYHRYLDLTGLRVSQNGLDSSSWNDEWWEIRWNERGLCEDRGGLSYNLPYNYYSISIVYVQSTWCTTDPRYNIPNDNACDNCENPTRGDAGIKQAPAFSFSMHPNPADDHLQIVFPFEDSRKIEITDLWGRGVLHFDCVGTACELNVHDLSPGMYHLRVATESGAVGTKRVVVQ